MTKLIPSLRFVRTTPVFQNLKTGTRKLYHIRITAAPDSLPDHIL